MNLERPSIRYLVFRKRELHHEFFQYHFMYDFRKKSIMSRKSIYQPSMNSPKLTVQLVTWNGAKYIPYLFESLKKQTYADWDLAVLDNASSDGTARLIEI